MEQNKDFGVIVTNLINRKNHTRAEIKDAFNVVLNNETTEMQQGAFLAALTAKGETADEVAGAWEAIYDYDTIKTSISSDKLVENCGTGMDSIKTFNISTAASIIAAADGIKMARHGARAITSICGTVDLAEALGVDVECDIETIEKSIEETGIGLFNGMSPKIHPNALGRILAQISFGSTLNIAASLANPALPKKAVRGVYSKDLLRPAAEVMKEIGYERAIVLFGGVENSEKGMDEASVCGTTFCMEITNSDIKEFNFKPEDFGLSRHAPELLHPEKDIETEVVSFLNLISGNGCKAKTDALILNAGILLYTAGNSDTITKGVKRAESIIKDGRGIEKLREWVRCQNSDPQRGLNKFNSLLRNSYHRV